jgi:hypothetical protein
VTGWATLVIGSVSAGQATTILRRGTVERFELTKDGRLNFDTEMALGRIPRGAVPPESIEIYPGPCEIARVGTDIVRKRIRVKIAIWSGNPQMT